MNYTLESKTCKCGCNEWVVPFGIRPNWKTLTAICNKCNKHTKLKITIVKTDIV